MFPLTQFYPNIFHAQNKWRHLSYAISERFKITALSYASIITSNFLDYDLLLQKYKNLICTINIFVRIDLDLLILRKIPTSLQFYELQL